MRFLKTSLTLLGAVTVLVLAGNSVVLATTGHSLLLGKSNSADATTSITRTTSGSVLKLQSKSSTNSPLTVNGKGKVTNLNADTVDGIDSSKLGTRVLRWVYTGAIGSSANFTLTGLPKGTYLINYETFATPGQVPDGSSADCYLVSDPTTGSNRYSGESTGQKTPYGTAVNGTGLVTKNSTDTVQLVCRISNAAATWNASADEPVRVSAVPVLGVTSMGAPSTARIHAKR
ncbi:MAG: hypothetical protein ACJ716_03525 [Marmoricola sp.]